MIVWRNWTQFVAVALGAVAFLMLATRNAHAGMLPFTQARSDGAKESPLVQPNQSTAASITSLDAQALWRSVRTHWESVREGMERMVLESMTTMILGRWGSPPALPMTLASPQPLPVPVPVPVPVPLPVPGPLPAVAPVPVPVPEPPTGSNDPPIDPILEPPPQGTPEPASLVTALLGAGLVSVFAWRRRRRHPLAA